MSEEIKTGEKSGIKMEEYNGVFSLVAMNNGYQTWAKFKKNKTDYMEKDWPVKVILGDKQSALAALTLLIGQISGGKAEPHGEKVNPVPIEQVPF